MKRVYLLFATDILLFRKKNKPKKTEKKKKRRKNLKQLLKRETAAIKNTVRVKNVFCPTDRRDGAKKSKLRKIMFRKSLLCVDFRRRHFLVYCKTSLFTHSVCIGTYTPEAKPPGSWQALPPLFATTSTAALGMGTSAKLDGAHKRFPERLDTDHLELGTSAKLDGAHKRFPERVDTDYLELN